MCLSLLSQVPRCRSQDLCSADFAFASGRLCRSADIRSLLQTLFTKHFWGCRATGGQRQLLFIYTFSVNGERIRHQLCHAAGRPRLTQINNPERGRCKSEERQCRILSALLDPLRKGQVGSSAPTDLGPLSASPPSTLSPPR